MGGMKHGRSRAFMNMVLGKILEPNRIAMKGEWRKLYNEHLHNLYSSPNIIWIIKSRRTR
jgi:hypothetical protein